MPKSFAFVLDFTYDGQKVFALEMGDFFKSGVEGLNRLRKEQNQITLHDEYNNILRQRYPTAIYLEDESTSWTSAVQFHDFSNGFKARCNFKGYELIPNLLYSRALLGAEHFFDRPVLASLQTSGFAPWLRSPLSKLLKSQKNTLNILNYPSGVLIDACQDKVVFHQFTAATGFCPATMLIDLNNVNLNDIMQFIGVNSSSHYVIKPTNMSLGRGVEIISSDKVIEFFKKLQTIANGSAINYSFLNNFKDLSIWNHIILEKGNHFLLLQKCCPSKEIKYKEDVYRPTGRAVIEVTFSDDLSHLPSLNFLGSYWKFPTEKAGTHTALSLISHVEDDSPIAAIEANDWQKIESQLQAYLPSILLNLYSTDFDQLSTYFESTPALQCYQKILGIDKSSYEPQHPTSDKALLYFKDFTYGGPGFVEYLEHFKNTFCVPSLPLVDGSKPKNTETSNAIANELTFFKSSHNTTYASIEKKGITVSDTLLNCK
ncbi:hypothetical protein ACNVED_15170 (plasmid) [Legionella sp. D16C41]|uniref:hypothetical protein n=1 Tax=Legionella sp. D16C41 TaxID=3402688 RepID=UPI003AF41722